MKELSVLVKVVSSFEVDGCDIWSFCVQEVVCHFGIIFYYLLLLFQFFLLQFVVEPFWCVLLRLFPFILGVAWFSTPETFNAILALSFEVSRKEAFEAMLDWSAALRLPSVDDLPIIYCHGWLKKSWRILLVWTVGFASLNYSLIYVKSIHYLLTGDVVSLLFAFLINDSICWKDMRGDFSLAIVNLMSFLLQCCILRLPSPYHTFWRMLEFLIMLLTP
jgi:hypothetical protein